MLSGCNEKHTGKMELKIEKYIKSNCNTLDSCKVDLSKVTSFQWDILYIFKETASLEEIQKIMGIEYPYYQDVARRLVFIKNNQIVYHEDIFPNVENIEEGQIIFNIPDSINFIKFTKKQFNVKKEISGEESYYLLSQ